MKKAGLTAIIALGLSPIYVHAQDFEEHMNKGFFIGEDAGAVFQQRGTISQSATPNESVTYNPGARADIDLGYNFCRSFATEFESGFMWNSIDKADGQPLSVFDENVNIYSIPILGNFVFRMPTHCGLVPYVGIGGGANVSVIEETSSGQRYHDSDIEPAVQAEVGLNYRLCPNASLGIGYKFLGTFNQHYFLNQFGLADHATLQGIYIHGIFLTFNWNF